MGLEVNDHVSLQWPSYEQPQGSNLRPQSEQTSWSQALTTGPPSRWLTRTIFVAQDVVRPFFFFLFYFLFTQLTNKICFSTFGRRVSTVADMEKILLWLVCVYFGIHMYFLIYIHEERCTFTYVILLVEDCFDYFLV
jgi:hypothetical protein